MALVLTAGIGLSCIPASAIIDDGKFAIRAESGGSGGVFSVFGFTSQGGEDGGGSEVPDGTVKGASFRFAAKAGGGYSNGSSVARIDSAGQVWSWGRGTNSILGQGDTRDQLKPVKVAGLEGMSSVSMGTSHGLALAKDGTVRAWGSNTSGQLGIGTDAGASNPVTTVPGLSDVVSISAVGFGSYAVTKSGEVFYWGKSAAGSSLAPVKIEGLTGIETVSVSYSGIVNDGSALYALNSSGEVFTVGQSKSGLLGLGDGVISSPTPAKIEGLPEIKHIANSMSGALAVGVDGSVWNWGTSMSKGSNFFAPTELEIPGKAIQAASTNLNEAVLLEDGSVYAWGDNLHGQLGIDRVTENFTAPMKIQLPEAVNAVAIGNGNLYFTTASDAVFATGDGLTLGTDRPESSGWDTTKPTQLVPKATEELGGFSAVDLGSNMIYGKTKSGDLYAWGKPSTGYQLGFGAWGAQAPRKLKAFSDVQSFDSRSDQTWVVNGDGQLYGWGRVAFWSSTYADGATGSAQSVSIPSKAGSFGGGMDKWLGLAGLSIEKISTIGNTNTAFLTTDGKIYSRSGLRTTLPYKFQLQSTPGSHVWKDVAAAGGGMGYAALKDDGTVWTFNNKSVKMSSVTSDPVQIQGLSNIVAISDTNDEIYALDSSGRVFSATSSAVKEITGLPKITAVKGAGASGLALDEAGSLWVWGTNNNGQLGTGNTTDVGTPTKLTGVSNIVDFDTTGATTVALSRDGKIYAWGNSALKIVGDGLPNAYLPVKVS